MDDLSRYPFAEQDFLNEYYRGALAATALHLQRSEDLAVPASSLWDASAVKNIHYIIDKPWDNALDPDDRYYAVNKLWWDVRRRRTAGYGGLMPVEPGMVPEWMPAGSAGAELTSALSGAELENRFVDFGAVHVVTVKEMADRRTRIAGLGSAACVGVYAEVLTEGRVSIQDATRQVA